jgi:hypothetical protein
MTDCVTLWIGDRLGLVERACLRSVVRQGHSLALYCYGRPQNVPEGVEVHDASAILPQTAIFRHTSGSVGPFSDWFRYEIQRRGLGIWVDTDIYLLRPLDVQRPTLFGEQQPGMINNAILRLPPDSPVVGELLRTFEKKTTPRWLPARDYYPERIREWMAGGVDLSRLRWGTTGPHGLTALARKFGIASAALPAEIFYPVPWWKAEWIGSPDVALDDVLTPATVAIHLWNECIRGLKDQPAPARSFLHRLQREGE